MFVYKNRSLIPLKKEYLPLLRKWRNEQIEFLRQNKPLSVKDQLNWWRKVKNDKEQSLFAIKEDDKFIGYCGLVHLDLRHKRAELSFLVDTKRVKDRKLYAEDFSSAIYMLCKFGFLRLKLHKIFIDTFIFRKDHLRIIEKFGFKKEAILRQHYLKRGRYYDSIIQSLLFKEWQALIKNKKYAVEK